MIMTTISIAPSCATPATETERVQLGHGSGGKMSAALLKQYFLPHFRNGILARLGDLEVSLAGRGIRLVASDDRVELVTAPDAGPLVARYVGADVTRLSPASLETLAIVAYRQPVTKSVIERIRGVDSDYSLRTLVHRRLVVELGRADTPGRPFLYGTGFDFLERFGLTSLDELPPLDSSVAERLFAVDDDAPTVEPDGGPTIDPRSVGPGRVDD